MQIEGKVKVINAEQQVSATFKKRELVVTTDEQYPQHIQIDFVQDKCDLLNNFNIGDNVKVSINLRGKEWLNPQGETKYFNSIQGWRIESNNNPSQQNFTSANQPNSFVDTQQPFSPEEERDDLPF